MEAFDDPGDIVIDEMDDEGLVEIVDLTDAGGETNVGQEFYLVIVNNGESELGYSIEYSVPSNDDGAEGGEEQGGSGNNSKRKMGCFPFKSPSREKVLMNRD